MSSVGKVGFTVTEVQELCRATRVKRVPAELVRWMLQRNSMPDNEIDTFLASSDVDPFDAASYQPELLEPVPYTSRLFPKVIEAASDYVHALQTGPLAACRSKEQLAMAALWSAQAELTSARDKNAPKEEVERCAAAVAKIEAEQAEQTAVLAGLRALQRAARQTAATFVSELRGRDRHSPRPSWAPVEER
jgi:hypothetical protein